jgi:hypothetical protein
MYPSLSTPFLQSTFAGTPAADATPRLISSVIYQDGCQWSANDAVVFLDLRDDLRIGQLVRGLDSDDTFSQRLGATETLLELQLGPKIRTASGCPS